MHVVSHNRFCIWCCWMSALKGLSVIINIITFNQKSCNILFPPVIYKIPPFLLGLATISDRLQIYEMQFEALGHHHLIDEKLQPFCFDAHNCFLLKMTMLRLQLQIYNRCLCMSDFMLTIPIYTRCLCWSDLMLTIVKLDVVKTGLMYKLVVKWDIWVCQQFEINWSWNWDMCVDSFFSLLSSGLILLTSRTWVTATFSVCCKIFLNCSQ